jgi:serine/threonine protein kinase
MKASFATKKEYRQRFVREAQATALLDHPHVVPIYHVDEESGVPYFAMKLLTGHSLEERLRQVGGSLPPNEVLRIGEEVADALDAAHQSGLIHRDVKPTNIWLETDADRVKLIDFGLVRVLDDDLRLTGTGFVVGTPSYMAPEQASGDETDFRCDLFSLGCVLYRASTGQLPFPGQYAVDVVAAIRSHNPTPPREVVPLISPAFSELILQLLAKKPEGRPASAKVVRDTLRRLRGLSKVSDHAIVTGSPETRRPRSTAEAPAVNKAGGRRWTLIAVAAVSVAAAAAALYFAFKP